MRVFISSTFTDLEAERQAAIDAILKTDNRPVGMELFMASDNSQFDVIKRHLDKCDVFLLILGGRYGSIEPTSGKSYVQLEYEYAKSNNMKMFSLVISEGALLQKQTKLGYPNVMELKNQEQYEDFKNTVLGYMCEFFDDEKDIKYSIATKLGQISNNDMKKTIEKLTKEIEKLQTKTKSLDNRDNTSQCPNYRAIKNSLKNTAVIIKQSPNSPGLFDQITNVLEMLIKHQNDLTNGIVIHTAGIRSQGIIPEQVIPHLKKFNLLEEYKDMFFGGLRLSPLGIAFLRDYEIEKYSD